MVKLGEFCLEDRAARDRPAVKNRSFDGTRIQSTPPLYPFGYGLSYTQFEYSNLTVDCHPDELVVSANVKNAGQKAGNEIVQFYYHRENAPVAVPNFQLCGFKRIYLLPGESQMVNVQIPLDLLDLVNEQGDAIREPGTFKLYVGGQQPDERSAALTGKNVLVKEISLP